MRYFAALRKDFNGVRQLWSGYWAVYGGFSSLFSSTYFVVALLVTALHFGAWLHVGWWDTVIAVTPTILGFTLAGLAVFLGMDSGFSKFIAEPGKTKYSPFMALVAAFVHFIVVQAVALLVAMTIKSLQVRLDGMPDLYYEIIWYGNRVFWFFGYFLYVYSLIQIFSATFAIFRASRWYESYVSQNKSD